MPKFLTAEELKSYPLPVKQEMWAKITDEQINTVIEYASQNIEDFCDRHFASAYYSEVIPGNGRGFLILENRPLISVQNLYHTDAYANIVTYSTDLVSVDANAGIIRFAKPAYYAFWKGYFWTVEYYAGYPTIPGPVKHATALQTISMLQPMFRGGTNFVEVDLIEGINETIVDLLDKYKTRRLS